MSFDKVKSISIDNKENVSKKEDEEEKEEKEKDSKNNNTTAGSGGLSLIKLVIGAVGAVVVVIIIIYFMSRKNAKKEEEEEEERKKKDKKIEELELEVETYKDNSNKFASVLQNKDKEINSLLQNMGELKLKIKELTEATSKNNTVERAINAAIDAEPEEKKVYDDAPQEKPHIITKAESRENKKKQKKQQSTLESIIEESSGESAQKEDNDLLKIIGNGGDLSSSSN